MQRMLCQIVFCCALSVCLSGIASAKTLCVNQSGNGGCYSTINAAVAHAAPHDTIRVARGTYAEDVVIGKPLSLIGDDHNKTIIDATGLSNGIYIDGIDNAGLREVVVNGFTVTNANFEGILIANAAYVTIVGNNVVANDRNLNFASATCPGLPAFETSEGEDCGEGIHLSGVHHATISNNSVMHNSGGILLSDDTGTTHHNLISGNVVEDNALDCGITLASHPPATLTGSAAPLGVFRNTISQNFSTRNGLQGGGAGIGIFDSVPGARNYANVVIGNTSTDNGLPGIAMHSHTPGQDLNNNVIVGNRISGNGPDTEDAATPGPTGINVFGVSPVRGTIISQNIISDETVDLAVNTPAYLDVHLNDFFGRKIGVANLGTGSVDATENWWGCAQGPSGWGCATISGPNVLFEPWLTSPFLAGTAEEHGH